jgi:biopolymer transport protein ExbD
MRLPQTSRSTVRRISLTPLIDIVFILLLFFILESNFLQFGELVFNTPTQEDTGSAPLSVMELQVFADGRIWLDGRSLQASSLDTYLAEKNFDSATPVFVRVHDELPLQQLVRVVDVLQGHALTNLQVLALEE